MSHYNISYSSLREEEKPKQAIRDIIDWLGSKRKFTELTKAFRAEKPNQRAFTFYCGLAGVQYYPVIAWWKHCFPDLPWLDEQEED